jgi:hypothetical protein
MKLKDIQAWALINNMEHDGLFAPVAIGGGKTLISLKCCADMWRHRGHERTLLLAPSSVMPQTHRSVPWYAERFELYGMPFQFLSGKSRGERERLAKRNFHGCYVVPWSLLSREGAEDLLEMIDATYVFGDEIHEVKNARARRTARFFKWMARQKPKFGCTSGTITTKTPMEFHHLLWSALKDEAPLPFSQSDCMDLAMLVSSGANDWDVPKHVSERYQPMRQWAQRHHVDLDVSLDHLKNDTKGFRTAFQARLRSAPGVVYDDTFVGASLLMPNLEAPPTAGHERVVELIKQVDKGISPNGDVIAEAMHGARMRQELAAGFYNEQVWPSLDRIPAAPGLTPEEILELSQTYHETWNDYLKTFNKWASHRARKDLDTVFLVGKDMTNNGATNVGHELYDAWENAKALDFPERVDRFSRSVRVCDYKIQQAKKLAESKAWQAGGGLLYYTSKCVGAWLHEDIPEAVFCPAGKVGSERIGTDTHPVSEGKVCIVSIGGHYQGKNLQFHERSHFVEWDRVERRAEQVLGRIHRNGQKLDAVVQSTSFTQRCEHEAFAATLNDACYVQQTMGDTLRLMVATYEPAPLILPTHVLQERGYSDVKPLDDKGQALLASIYS